jgi:hypothetical protein
VLAIGVSSKVKRLRKDSIKVNREEISGPVQGISKLKTLDR